MARKFIQSDNKKGKVSKLCYTIKSPYQILRNTCHGNYFVKKLYKPDSPDSPELYFMANDLYPLSPSLKHCEPVDTTDKLYLNQSYASFTISLKKSLYIV